MIVVEESFRPEEPNKMGGEVRAEKVSREGLPDLIEALYKSHSVILVQEVGDELVDIFQQVGTEWATQSWSSPKDKKPAYIHENFKFPDLYLYCNENPAVYLLWRKNEDTGKFHLEVLLFPGSSIDQQGGAYLNNCLLLLQRQEQQQA